MKKDPVAEYNRLLDFCRNIPQRKFNIEMELGIAAGRLGTMLTRLVTRGLMKSTPSKTNAKVFEYLSHPEAEYTILPTNSGGRPKAVIDGNGIVVQGNVTTVTSYSYHTKGSSRKRSVWIGSSADM